MKAFADDTKVADVGGLTVENGTERITIYGESEITRDKAGLAAARRLKEILDSAIEALETDDALPDSVKSLAALKTKKNPLL